jgi:antitoxin (DNA-binding transcriptional repressor) of toxin-antitoxin stability system
MEIVGIRKLKVHLTRHLKRVRFGAWLGVSADGRIIAVISPVETPADVAWAHRLVSTGRACWSGGKPVGIPRPAPVARGGAVSSTMLADRR